MDLSRVYNKIEDNNIKIFPFGVDGIKAVTIETDGKYGIFMNTNEIRNSSEEFSVLAHEYGHCTSGSTHVLYSPYDLICQHEYRADRQSILELLPVELIKNAIKDGHKLSYEIAEYLDIPEEFVNLAIKHYMAMKAL